MKFLIAFHQNEQGSTSVEYCVMLGLIITVCIAAVAAVGGSNNRLWGQNAAQLNLSPPAE